MVSAISILACHSSDPGRKRHSVGPEYTCGIGCSGRGLSAGRITDTSGSRGIRYVTLISYSLLMDVGVTDPVQVATPHRQRSWKLGRRLVVPALAQVLQRVGGVQDEQAMAVSRDARDDGAEDVAESQADRPLSRVVGARERREHDGDRRVRWIVPIAEVAPTFQELNDPLERCLHVCGLLRRQGLNRLDHRLTERAPSLEPIRVALRIASRPRLCLPVGHQDAVRPIPRMWASRQHVEMELVGVVHPDAAVLPFEHVLVGVVLTESLLSGIEDGNGFPNLLPVEADEFANEVEVVLQAGERSDRGPDPQAALGIDFRPEGSEDGARCRQPLSDGTVAGFGSLVLGWT